MYENKGGHAFPTDDMHPGMSLRDYFATSALQGFCAHELVARNMGTPSMAQTAAETAYRFADAMMAARGF